MCEHLGISMKRNQAELELLLFKHLGHGGHGFAGGSTDHQAPGLSAANAQCRQSKTSYWILNIDCGFGTRGSPLKYSIPSTSYSTHLPLSVTFLQALAAKFSPRGDEKCPGCIPAPRDRRGTARGAKSSRVAPARSELLGRPQS